MIEELREEDHQDKLKMSWSKPDVDTVLERARKELENRGAYTSVLEKKRKAMNQRVRDIEKILLRKVIGVFMAWSLFDIVDQILHFDC